MGLQKANLGTGLYNNARDYNSGEPLTPSPMCAFTIMDNDNFVPWTGKTFSTSLRFRDKKRKITTTIYAVVNWIPTQHGIYGYRIRKRNRKPEDYLPNSKLIPFRLLYFSIEICLVTNQVNQRLYQDTLHIGNEKLLKTIIEQIVLNVCGIRLFGVYIKRTYPSLSIQS